MTADEYARAEDQLRRHFLFEWTAAQQDAVPLHIRNARGAWFEKDGGKKYLDFCSSQFNLSLGYQHPKILDAIEAQLRELAYGPSNTVLPVKGALVEKLAALMPGDIGHTFLTLGGADANENAFKIARMVTGRPKILARYRSYHGATYGAITASGDPRRIPVEPGVQGVIHVLDPFCDQCPFGQRVESCHVECAQHIEEVILYEGPDTIAALIIEPITGSNGVIPPPKTYLADVRAICDKYGVLLICDEVITGYGRTGAWFGVDHWNVVPDIMVTSKGLSNCYAPLGAVSVRPHIADHFHDAPFMCGLTQGAHPLGCAAALACVTVCEEDDLPARAQTLGAVQSERLDAMHAAHDAVRAVRNIGLLGCVELDFGDGDRARPPGPYWNAPPATDSPMTNVVATLDALGLATLCRWNWIFIAPPLTITEDDHALGLDLIDKAIASV